MADLHEAAVDLSFGNNGYVVAQKAAYVKEWEVCQFGANEADLWDALDLAHLWASCRGVNPRITNQVLKRLLKTRPPTDLESAEMTAPTTLKTCIRCGTRRTHRKHEQMCTVCERDAEDGERFDQEVAREKAEAD